MKRIDETDAGKSIGVAVIMRGSRHVATMRSYHAKTGGVTVEIYQNGEALARCHKALPLSEKDRARMLANLPDYYQNAKPEALESWLAHERFSVQRGHAGGYGYDKKTAALSGMIVDGLALSNHCGRDKSSARWLREWRKVRKSGGDTSKVEERARKAGYSFANWQGAEAESIARNMKRHGMTEKQARERCSGYSDEFTRKHGGYMDCYRREGLEFLAARGYHIIHGI